MTQVCLANASHAQTWTSQSQHGTLPQGNPLLAVEILFSGASPTKALNLMLNPNIATIHRRTFNLMQGGYLVPAVSRVCERQRSSLVLEAKKESSDIDFGGDTRCDSPGHCAKYSKISTDTFDFPRSLKQPTMCIHFRPPLPYQDNAGPSPSHRERFFWNNF